MTADQTARAEEILIKDLCKEGGATSEETTTKEEGEEIFSHTIMTQINIILIMRHPRLKITSLKSQSKKIFIM
jgi:hypothetical protein